MRTAGVAPILSLALLASSSIDAAAPFRPRFPVETGGSPDIVSGDFNEDGFADFVVAGADGTSLNVELGDGTGGFARSPATPVLDRRPAALAAGDLDGDGHLDLVAGTAENAGGDKVEVMHGNGDGSFASPTSWPAGDFVLRVALFDAGQGHAGLAVTAGNSYSLKTFRVLPDGSLSLRGTYDMAAGPTDIAVADVNEDGVADLIVSTVGNLHAFSVLLGVSDGRFQPPVEHYFDSSSWSNTIAAGDFDRDGHADVAIACGDGPAGHVALFAGRGDATFDDPTFLESPTADVGLVAADMDGDGIIDLVVGERTHLTYYAGNGDGSFRSAGNFQGPAAGIYGQITAFRIATADLDNDGRLDLLVPDVAVQYTNVFLGDTVFASSLQ